MDTITAEIEDLEQEIHEEDLDEVGAELGTDGDDVASGYEDRLSESIQARIRHHVPRNVVHAGEAGNGYCEVLVERPAIVNEIEVDQVGLALIEEGLAPKAQQFSGTLASEFMNDQLLELSYRYVAEGEKTGFVYTISLDGKWIKGFRHPALARLAFDVILDRAQSEWDGLIRDTIDYFHSRGVARGEDKYDTCSEDFTAEVLHNVRAW